MCLAIDNNEQARAFAFPVATPYSCVYIALKDANEVQNAVNPGKDYLDDLKKETIDRIAGADKVSFNSAAVANPDVVAEAADHFGSQCIVVAIDAKAVEGTGFGGRWEVFTHGGRNRTGRDAVEWAQRMEEYGAGEILLTSMDRDGTKSGFDVELTRAIADTVNVPVIASGGVGTLDHLVEGARDGHASAVLAASIFHFGEHSLGEAKVHMAAAGVPVRPVSGAQTEEGR